MKIEKAIKDISGDIIEYYNQCWLTRFEAGHNPLSLAMHMGYFDEPRMDNDHAKLNANKFLTSYIAIPHTGNCTIADLGCGVGGTCLYLAENFPDAHIAGVNISAKQIEFANALKNGKNREYKVTYHVADYAATGLPAGTFDFVMGIESICHAPYKLKVYSEAYRLLKPGGCFAFMDYFEVKSPITPLQERLLTDFRKGWAVDAYITNADTELQQIGFKSVKGQSIVAKVQPGIEYSYKKAIQALSKVSYNTQPVFYNHLKACIALKELVDDNLIDYRVVQAIK